MPFDEGDCEAADREGIWGEVTVWTVGRYLRRWGFTPQKPLRLAYEQNSEEVRVWLEEEYPKIKKKAGEEGMEPSIYAQLSILFEDRL